MSFSTNTINNEPTTPSMSNSNNSNEKSSDNKNNSNSNINNNKTKKIGKVIIVGSANQDLTCYATTTPRLGETVLGTSFQTSCGGKGANQAIAAASLGLPCLEVGVVCRLGEDGFANDLLDAFDEAGVTYDKTVIQAPGHHTGVAPIIVNSQSGDNMIVVVPGANRALTPTDVRSGVRLLLDDSTNETHTTTNSIGKRGRKNVIVTQLEIRRDAALEAMKVGKEMGALTILNPAPAQEMAATVSEMDSVETEMHADADFYRNVDILVPNETELRTLYQGTGGDGMTVGDDQVPGGKEVEEVQMAKRLLQLGVKEAVIVTLGARGAMIVSRTQGINVTNKNDDEGFEITMVQADPNLPHHDQPVEDTVGAGDCFCGSLAAYLSTGTDLTDAATKACGVASMSVRKRGAQSSYPRREDLPDLLRIDPSSGDGDGGSRRSSTEAGVSSLGREITFVTGNKKKLEEVQRLLLSSTSVIEDGGKNNSIRLPFHITNKKIDLPELQGDPTEIAIEKCKLAATEVNGPVFTEDTCLCFNALNGMPGPYIKWFLDKCGHDGLNGMLNGFDDKTAYAQTIIAFTTGPGHEVHTFDGRTSGRIVKARGSLDFGWDPIFEPDCNDEISAKTYAEMEKDEKNSISHRSRSFAKFLPFLVEMVSNDFKTKDLS